jgi:Secretion system C-terminal sorting domain
MKFRFCFFLLSLLAAFSPMQAQQLILTGEHLVPLTGNPSQAKSTANQRSIAPVFYDTIPLPSSGIVDHFYYDSHTATDSIWDQFAAGNTGTFVNRSWGKSPINVGVCTFDGLNAFGMPYDSLASVSSTMNCDYLTSLPINLSNYDTSDHVFLSFWYQAQGFGYAPNPQDSFMLDVNIPAWNPNQSSINWKTVWFKTGYTPTGADTGFHIAMFELDSTSYFVKGFRFRFHNYAAGCGSNDHWHLDEVELGPGRTVNDTLVRTATFVYEMPSFLTKYWAMPYNHYKPAVHMAANANVQIRNNDTASRNIAYNYQVMDLAGNVLATYNGQSNILGPYSQVGYSSHPQHAHPDVYPSPFSGFPQNLLDTSSYIVRHKLIDGTRIDSVDHYQRFYNFYAYDDGTAEVGYGLYGAYSSLAYKFTNESDNIDTLTAFQMYFLPVQDIDGLRLREFSLVVWSDGGNGPGSVIYREKTQHIDYLFVTPDRFTTYTLDSGIVALSPGQTYYIGWEQIAPDRMYIGFDFNNDHHGEIYYNTNGTWLTSIFNGSLMIRPVFGDVYDATGVNEPVTNPAAAFVLYPNPANDRVTVSINDPSGKYFASVTDITGRELITLASLDQANSMDVSILPNGVYFVQLRDENQQMIGVQRLVIQR